MGDHWMTSGRARLMTMEQQGRRRGLGRKRALSSTGTYFPPQQSSQPQYIMNHPKRPRSSSEFLYGQKGYVDPFTRRGVVSSNPMLRQQQQQQAAVGAAAPHSIRTLPQPNASNTVPPHILQVRPPPNSIQMSYPQRRMRDPKQLRVRGRLPTTAAATGTRLGHQATSQANAPLQQQQLRPSMIAGSRGMVVMRNSPPSHVPVVGTLAPGHVIAPQQYSPTGHQQHQPQIVMTTSQTAAYPQHRITAIQQQQQQQSPPPPPFANRTRRGALASFVPQQQQYQDSIQWSSPGVAGAPNGWTDGHHQFANVLPAQAQSFEYPGENHPPPFALDEPLSTGGFASAVDFPMAQPPEYLEVENVFPSVDGTTAFHNQPLVSHSVMDSNEGFSSFESKWGARSPIPRFPSPARAAGPLAGRHVGRTPEPPSSFAPLGGDGMSENLDVGGIPRFQKWRQMAGTIPAGGQHSSRKPKTSADDGGLEFFEETNDPPLDMNLFFHENQRQGFHEIQPTPTGERFDGGIDQQAKTPSPFVQSIQRFARERNASKNSPPVPSHGSFNATVPVGQVEFGIRQSLDSPSASVLTAGSSFVQRKKAQSLAPIDSFEAKLLHGFDVQSLAGQNPVVTASTSGIARFQRSRHQEIRADHTSSRETVRSNFQQSLTQLPETSRPPPQESGTKPTTTSPDDKPIRCSSAPARSNQRERQLTYPTLKKNKEVGDSNPLSQTPLVDGRQMMNSPLPESQTEGKQITNSPHPELSQTPPMEGKQITNSPCPAPTSPRNREPNVEHEVENEEYENHTPTTKATNPWLNLQNENDGHMAHPSEQYPSFDLPDWLEVYNKGIRVDLHNRPYRPRSKSSRPTSSDGKANSGPPSPARSEATSASTASSDTLDGIDFSKHTSLWK